MTGRTYDMSMVFDMWSREEIGLVIEMMFPHLKIIIKNIFSMIFVISPYPPFIHMHTHCLPFHDLPIKLLFPSVTILSLYWKWNFSLSPSVGRLVVWFVCQSLFPKRAGSFYFQAPIGALIHTLIPLKDSFIYLSALNSEWLSIYPSSMQTIFAVC